MSIFKRPILFIPIVEFLLILTCFPYIIDTIKNRWDNLLIFMYLFSTLMFALLALIMLPEYKWREIIGSKLWEAELMISISGLVISTLLTIFVHIKMG